jgi:hypothetical protein
MTYFTKAIYRQGAFFPESPFDLPDDSRVDLVVQGPSILPPVASEEERSRVLRQVTDRMKQNPVSADAPRFTREQLHERR